MYFNVKCDPSLSHYLISVFNTQTTTISAIERRFPPHNERIMVQMRARTAVFQLVSAL